MGLKLPFTVLRKLLRALFLVRRARSGRRYDAAVDAVNRLPRPLMALGALGFFAYAALFPPGFREWMGALQTVPEPVWWLVTGILGLHFGAREAYYLRDRGTTPSAPSGEDAA